MTTTIETPRLVLTPAGADDVDALHGLWIDPDVRRYLWDDAVISRERAAEAVHASRASFDARGFGIWIARLRSGPLAGFAGLRALDDDVELLVGIAPHLWKQRLGAEAAGAVLRFAFDRLGLTRVIGQADPPNLASIRLMESLGMRPIGRVVTDGLTLERFVIDAGPRIDSRA